MANEEMRRLQLRLRELEAAQQAAAQGGTDARVPTATGGGIQGPAEAYSWKVKVPGYSSATVNSGDEVTLVGGNNVTVEQNSRTITILGKANIYWDAFADSGNVRVPDESRLNFYGENGVSTRVDTSTRSIIINRPLQVRRRASDIGLPDTTILDFWNPEINKPKHYTEQVYFWVEDQDNGERRISAYVSPGDYSWDFKTDTNVIETVTNAELVTFVGGANVTVTNVGNVITIAAVANPGTLQLQQEGTNIGPNDTATINWDNDTVLKPVGYTSRVWTQVINDGAGVRRIVSWYDATGGAYYWNLQANGGATTQIDTTETVNFAAGGNLAVARVGNTITYSYTAPATYSWFVSANYGAAEEITTGETLTFANGLTTQWSRAGSALTVQRPLQLQQNSVNVGANDTMLMNFDGDNSGLKIELIRFEVSDLTSGNRTVRGYYRQGLTQYAWQIQTTAGNVAPLTVNNGTVITVNGLNGVSAERVGSTININRPLQIQQNAANIGGADTTSIDYRNATGAKPAGYTAPVYFDVTDFGGGNRRVFGWYEPGAGVYSWTASDGANTAAVTNGETVVLTGDSGVVVTLNAGTQTYTIDRPLQIKDDGANVGNDSTISINYDSVGATGTNYIEWELADVGAGERRVRGKYNVGAGQYFWNLQAGGGAVEQIDSNENVNFAAGGNLTVARAGNTITYTYNQPAAYTWVASDNTNTATVTTTETVKWVGDSGVTVALDPATQTFTVDRPLQIEDDGVAVGNDATTALNFDSNGGTGTSYAEFEVADIGGGERRVRVKYNAGAGQYYWNLQANGGAIEQIDSNESVNFAASGDLTVARSGNTITYSYTQPAAYNWVASDGPNNSTVSSTNEVTWLGAKGVNVNLDILTKTFTIERALQIRDDGVNVGNDSTAIINFDSNGAVGSSYIEWELADVAGVRQVRGKYSPSASTYNWLLAASSSTGTDTITSGETVTFKGQAGIRVTRSGSTVIIEPDPDDPPGGGGTAKRILTGELTFSPVAPDYLGGLPAYRYGTRQYVDIVHNWNLSNFNNFHLELIDRALDDVGVSLAYYRSGAGAISGVPNLGNQRFRNIPHWAAQDRNTIRVWATMSRLKPTPMKFRYTLVEL
jgi:predicted transcriptional regulator